MNYFFVSQNELIYVNEQNFNEKIDFFILYLSQVDKIAISTDLSIQNGLKKVWVYIVI